MSAIEKQLRALKEEKGLKFTVALRCEAPQAAKEAIARRVGLGIIYEDVAKEDIKHGRSMAIESPRLHPTRADLYNLSSRQRFVGTCGSICPSAAPFPPEEIPRASLFGQSKIGILARRRYRLEITSICPNLLILGYSADNHGVFGLPLVKLSSRAF
jgi:hypothetical protein